MLDVSSGCFDSFHSWLRTLTWVHVDPGYQFYTKPVLYTLPDADACSSCLAAESSEGHFFICRAVKFMSTDGCPRGASEKQPPQQQVQALSEQLHNFQVSIRQVVIDHVD